MAAEEKRKEIWEKLLELAEELHVDNIRLMIDPTLSFDDAKKDIIKNKIARNIYSALLQEKNKANVMPVLSRKF